MVDICKVNGWLLYRRHCNQLGILKKKKKILSSGRPKKRSLSPTSIVGRKAAVPKPMADLRYNYVDHFPKFNEKRNQYSFCPDAIALCLVQSVKLCSDFEKRKVVFLTSIIWEILLNKSYCVPSYSNFYYRHIKYWQVFVGDKVKFCNFKENRRNCSDDV